MGRPAKGREGAEDTVYLSVDEVLGRPARVGSTESNVFQRIRLRNHQPDDFAVSALRNLYGALKES